MVMLPSDEIIEQIKKNDLFKYGDVFSSLDKDELDSAIQKIHISQININETVFNQGDEGNCIILLLKGTVGIYVKNKDDHEVYAGYNRRKNDREVSIATMEENSFFGEMALIDSTVRMATIRALSDCVLGTINESDFWNYFHKHLGMAKNILKGLNAKLRETNKNFVEKLIKEKEELTRFNQELEIKVKEKTEELRQKDMQLLEMDRIAGIGTLAAGIAHEINNPMSFVKSSVSFLKKGVDKMSGAIAYWNDKPLPEPLFTDFKGYLVGINYDHLTNSLENKFDTINRGIERIIKIVGNLKSFSRVDMEAKACLDINQSIEQAMEVLGARDDSVERKVNYIKEFDDIPPYVCQASEINQCLLHIIGNARDAVQNEGTIKLITSYDNREKQIIITIIDNGTGMSEETLKKAFTPFFTTKPVGSGTGIGLTITERIVKRHGGKINLASKPGEGTTVTLSVPVLK
jgi:signal transduction histidine kinase